MREGLKDDRYNLRLPPPEQLVPRRLRLGVRERLRADGRIETPLDPGSLDRAIEVLKREEVEAVAVCYLHAYRDPRHELATQSSDRTGTARNLRLALLGGAPADQGIREGLDYRRQRLCRTGLVALFDAARAQARGSRLRRPDVDHPVAWRRRADCRGRAPRGRSGAVRPGRRHRRQRACRAVARGRQSDPVRHGRHQHRHLADRRRPSRHLVTRPPCRRPRDRAEQPRHRQHRRGRRLDRPGRRRRHPACRPAERRRRSRAPPATALAAPPRP